MTVSHLERALPFSRIWVAGAWPTLHIIVPVNLLLYCCVDIPALLWRTFSVTVQPLLQCTRERRYYSCVCCVELPLRPRPLTHPPTPDACSIRAEPIISLSSFFCCFSLQQLVRRGSKPWCIYYHFPSLPLCCVRCRDLGVASCPLYSGQYRAAVPLFYCAKLGIYRMGCRRCLDGWTYFQLTTCTCGERV